MIDREKVERLIAALEQHGRRWKVGDDASEKRSADCTNASDTLRALSDRVAELEKERDEWASMVGQVVACLPLPEVVSASSTIGDLISALKEKLQSVDEARARVAELERHKAQLLEICDTREEIISRLTRERDEALRRRDAWKERAENHVQIVDALKAKTAGQDSRTLSKALLGAAFNQCEAELAEARARVAELEKERDALAERYKRIRAEERERCANVAVSYMSDDTSGLTHPYDQGWVRACQRIAAAIRKGDEDE